MGFLVEINYERDETLLKNFVTIKHHGSETETGF